MLQRGLPNLLPCGNDMVGREQAMPARLESHLARRRNKMANLMFRLVIKVEIFGKSFTFALGSTPDGAFKLVDLTGVIATAGITIKVLVA